MSAAEKINNFTESFECMKCIHFQVCANNLGGMDLEKCEFFDDSEPRERGSWIVENEYSIRCSNCCFNRALIKIPLDFCPKCGAEMYVNYGDGGIKAC